MNDFSYYCSLAAIFALQLAFYWYFKDDRRRRHLTGETIEEKKLAVLVAINSKDKLSGLSEFLRLNLEHNGFKVYEIIRSSQEDLGCKNSSCSNKFSELTFKLDFRLEDPSSLKQVVDCVEDELRVYQYKLHAYIDMLSCNLAEFTCEREMSSEKSIMEPLAINKSFEPMIVEQDARTIHVVRRQRRQKTGSPNSSSDNLVQFVESAISCQYIHSNNNSVVLLNQLAPKDSKDESKRLSVWRSFALVCLKFWNSLDRNSKSMKRRNKTQLLTRSKSDEKQVNETDKILVDTLVDLALRVYPPREIVEENLSDSMEVS